MTAARSRTSIVDANSEPSESVLRRPRLEERLDESFGRRLTTIVAGAGYGKSTLVSSWASDVDCAWHTVTAEDAAVPAFHRAIARALAEQVTGFPAELTTVSEGAATAPG